MTSEPQTDWNTPGHPDQLVFRTSLVTVGRFRCAVSHALFRDSGPIREPCIVFPRTAVVIDPEIGRPFVADPTIVTTYDAGDHYERRPVSPDGDRCDWYAIRPDVAREAARARLADARDDGARVFDRPCARSDAALYLRQRRFFTMLEAGHPVDPLAVEEEVLGLLDRVLGRARGGSRRPGPDPVAPRRARARDALVEAARNLTARRFREPLGLADLAAALGCSPFHLCRTFRAATGTTLHRHRTELRLRAALEMIESGTGLTRVALDLGFSSHSHFSATFRRAYGVAPSRASAVRQLAPAAARTRARI